MERTSQESQPDFGAPKIHKHRYPPGQTTKNTDLHKCQKITMPRSHRAQKNPFIILDLHLVQPQPSCGPLPSSTPSSASKHPLPALHYSSATQWLVPRPSPGRISEAALPTPTHQLSCRTAQPPEATPTEQRGKQHRQASPKRAAPLHQHTHVHLPQAHRRLPQLNQVQHSSTHHPSITRLHAHPHPNSHPYNYTQSQQTTPHKGYTLHKRHTRQHTQTSTHSDQIRAATRKQILLTDRRTHNRGTCLHYITQSSHLQRCHTPPHTIQIETPPPNKKPYLQHRK